MKPRNREINIFSLSLMDVISGAMGAFLIVMVILSQYYVFDPQTSEDADDLRQQLDAAIAGLAGVRNGTEEIFADLIESEQGATTVGLGGADSASGIEALAAGVAADIDRVSDHLASVHEKMNSLEEELQQKNAQIARADELVGKLEARRAFAAAAYWDCPANVDLFLESDRTSALSGERSRYFDARARQEQDFVGDGSSDTTQGPGVEMAMVGETPHNTRYKIFVNLLKPPPATVCAVVVHAIGFNAYFALPPAAVLTNEDPFDYLGALIVNDALEISFKAPSVEERAAELAAVSKRMAETPPPKTETTP